MGFNIVSDKDENHHLVLICDYCKKTINKYEDGNFLWDWHSPTFKNNNKETKIYYLHKWCNSTFEHILHPDISFAGREMEQFIIDDF